MNKPTQPNQLTVFELLAYLMALVITLLLLRWSWNRFDGVALLVAVVSPIIGLLCGALFVLLLGCSVFAFGYLFSADFRREIQGDNAASAALSDEEDKTN